MARRTKIVATIGPASESPTVMQRMVEAGMDVARLGLAHDSLDLQIERFFRLRAAAEAAGRPLGILVDLPGPKVRAGAFPDGGLELTDGQRLRLVPGTGRSTAEVVEVDYEGLLDDVQVGDLLMFGDGSVVVAVRERDGGALTVEVDHGGHLEGRPGVHVPSDRLRTPTPTPADLRMLDAFVEVGVDMVAVSFVRSAHDVRRVGTEPHPRGPLVIAKVETRAAVDNLEGIVAASGAIMVARGDLGAEFPIEELPHLQKRIIRKCIALGRPVITATQMLESMVHAPGPTRAEASDVANAILDGTSAVMLSGETAVGEYPVEAVEVMARIAAAVEPSLDYRHEIPSASDQPTIGQAMSNAACDIAEALAAKAILVPTFTGKTASGVARLRPRRAIVALTHKIDSLRHMALEWGVIPLDIPETDDVEDLWQRSVDAAREAGVVRAGERVVITAGTAVNIPGSTNVIRVDIA